MHRYTPLFGLITTLATGCASDAEVDGMDPDVGEHGELRVEVDAGELDPSRIRIGLFETDGAGSYTTTEGPDSGSVRLRLLVGNEDRVTVSVFDALGEAVDAGVESIAVQPVYEFSLDDFESAEDFIFDLGTPISPPEYPDDPEGELTASLIALVWYDAELNGALNLRPAGESETVRGLINLEADPAVTLSSLEFEHVHEGFAPEAGTPEYRGMWTMWGTDTAVGRSRVRDWSTRWTAVIASATETR